MNRALQPAAPAGPVSRMAVGDERVRGHVPAWATGLAAGIVTFGGNTVNGLPAPMPMALRANVDWLHGGAQYSLDGTRAVIWNGRSQKANVVDTATGQIAAPIDIGTERVFSLTPDGTMLLTQTFEGGQICDTESGVPIGAPFSNIWLGWLTNDSRDAVAFTGSGTQLERIHLTPDAWRAEACTVVHRELTSDEWQRFIGSELQHPTCSG
jgi:hypothetical protein